MVSLESKYATDSDRLPLESEHVTDSDTIHLDYADLHH